MAAAEVKTFDHPDETRPFKGKDIGPGTVFAIPPGHDPHVVGDEPSVLVDFGEIGDYAKHG